MQTKFNVNIIGKNVLAKLPNAANFNRPIEKHHKIVQTFDGRRREEGVVAGQQEAQQRLPGLPLEDLGLPSDILDSAEHPVTQNRLSVDRVLR